LYQCHAISHGKIAAYTACRYDFPVTASVVDIVRDLGVTFDPELIVQQDVNKVASSAFIPTDVLCKFDFSSALLT